MKCVGDGGECRVDSSELGLLRDAGSFLPASSSRVSVLARTKESCRVACLRQWMRTAQLFRLTARVRGI